MLEKTNSAIFKMHIGKNKNPKQLSNQLKAEKKASNPFTILTLHTKFEQ